MFGSGLGRPAAPLLNGRRPSTRSATLSVSRRTSHSTARSLPTNFSHSLPSARPRLQKDCDPRPGSPCAERGGGGSGGGGGGDDGRFGTLFKVGPTEAASPSRLIQRMHLLFDQRGKIPPACCLLCCCQSATWPPLASSPLPSPRPPPRCRRCDGMILERLWAALAAAPAPFWLSRATCATPRTVALQR